MYLRMHITQSNVDQDRIPAYITHVMTNEKRRLAANPVEAIAEIGRIRLML